MKRSAVIASVVASVVIPVTALTQAGGAVATPAGVQQSASVAKATVTTPTVYSDVDVVNFLVFFSGPIATKYPALAKQLKGTRQVPQVTDAQVKQFTANLMSVDPNFHTVVTMGVQANDPYKAQVALQQLNTDITAWLSKNSTAQPQRIQPDGLFKAKSNIAIYTNQVGVTQTAVFSLVAAAAEAVFVLTIVPAAVSYQFEMNKSSSLQRDTFTANVTRSLARA